MRITVAMCTYNGARYLAEQLASLAQQQRLPDEMIICDDRSSDSTYRLLEDFAKSAPFVVHYKQNAANLGSTRNFEQAIRLASGDVIALCDQDDFWYPQKLAVIEEAFRSSPQPGLVFSDADVVDGQRRRLGYTLWQSVRFSQKEQQFVSEGHALTALLRRPVVTGTTMAFQTRFRDLILPIPAAWIHDEWIALIIASMADVGVIAQTLLEYRVHHSNQVGAESTDVLARLKTGMRTDPAVYVKRHQQYRLLYDHVAQKLPPEAKLLARLEEKCAHLQLRGTLPRQNLRRIAPVLRELMRGRYHRYSGSWLNAVRDILLRH